MKAAIVLLTLFVVATMAQASCPNMCSGHGTCGTDDKCTCYEHIGLAAGTRVAWTGADCSLRTCPIALAWDTVSTQAQRIFPTIKTVSGTGSTSVLTTLAGDSFDANSDAEYIVRWYSTSSWKYKEDGDDEFTAEVSDLSSGQQLASSGIQITISGTAVAGDSWKVKATHNEGVDYSASDYNTIHQKQECSGRGSCDRSVGQCTCDVGYEGEACQRTICPNRCSGHGICQDLKHFASDAGEEYDTAWDFNKHMGCLCDAGFRGPDCSLRECPSGTDPLGSDQADATSRDCSGRGTCDYSTGVCSCHKGFYGERCNLQTVRTFT